jgi:hypothetical protein
VHLFTFLQAASADAASLDDACDLEDGCALQRHMQGSVHSASSPWSNLCYNTEAQAAAAAVAPAVLPHACKGPNPASIPVDSSMPSAPSEVPFAAVLLSPIFPKPPPAADAPNATQQPASPAAVTTSVPLEGLTPFSPECPAAAPELHVATPTAHAPATKSGRKARNPSLRVKPAITKQQQKKAKKAKQQAAEKPSKWQEHYAAAAGMVKLPASGNAFPSCYPIKP